ncbi:MAG: SCP2 sterol-binding domain-containing protein [Haloarculaceae archaeon]
MTATLPDEAGAWANDWRDRLNDNDAFADAAADLDARFLCEIRPDDAYDGDPVAFVIELANGTVPDAGGVDGDADYDFALRGPYTAWKDMLNDDIDVASAVLGGTFDVEGSMVTLMRYQEAFGEMIGDAQRIDTDFAY